MLQWKMSCKGFPCAEFAFYRDITIFFSMIASEIVDPKPMPRALEE